MVIPKLAFLFLTIGDIYHEPTWVNFFASHEDFYTLYVHSKHSLSKTSFFKESEIPDKIPTSWANTMRAQVALLREALKNPANEKFVFVSESTIPLRSFKEVYETLMSTPNSLFKYYRNTFARSFGPLSSDMILKNAQWVVLNRKHAQLMADDTELLKLMTHEPHDQEHYPSTFLAHHDLLSEVTKKDTTLAIWTGENGNAHPHSFFDLNKDPHASKLFKALENKRYLFARKIEKKCDLSPLKPYLPWIN